MCKHSNRVPLRERADNMKGSYEHGASPKAQRQAGPQSGQSGQCSRRGSDPRLNKSQGLQPQAQPQQQQFARQGKKQGQRFSKTDQQNNNVAVENTRHLKRHSTVQRASPSKHLHMLNNNNNVNGSSYGDRGTKNTSPIPSSLSRSSPVSIPGAAAAKSQGQPAYAGAKFSDPPSPKVLPKPPTHWVAPQADGKGSSCAEMTSVLKVMLKVQA